MFIVPVLLFLTQVSLATNSVITDRIDGQTSKKGPKL